MKIADPSKHRTYPRVDLSKVPNWIIALSYYSLPLIELSSMNLNKKERKGILSAEVKNSIIMWKSSKGLEDVDELEYKYFLEGIGAIKARPINQEDLDVPLSDNLHIRDIMGTEPLKAKKMYYLSRFGSQLAMYWTNGQYFLYEATLFWLLIRSKSFFPLLQKIVSDPRVYQVGLQDELIPSKDGMSRALVKKWLKYFGLIKQADLDGSRLAVLLFCASLMELNEKIADVRNRKEYVDELCHYLSDTFSISEVAVDFGVFLDYIYSHVDRSVVDGYPSGRGHRGLLSKPSVQILEIKKAFPLTILESIQVSEIKKAILLGG
ncbi:MAG: hypothetical protein QXF61_08150 [Nitrososphaeria archaeon]